MPRLCSLKRLVRKIRHHLSQVPYSHVDVGVVWGIEGAIVLWCCRRKVGEIAEASVGVLDIDEGIVKGTKSNLVSIYQCHKRVTRPSAYGIATPEFG